MVDRWVKIEEYRKVNRLIGIQELILEAEALDFVEVQSAFLWEDLVNGDSSDRLIRTIVHFVESKSSLTSVDQELRRFRLELPRDFILCMTHETNPPLTEHIDVLWCYSVVLRMLRHSEAERLTDHIVEGNCQKVAAKEKQTEPIDSIEFTPLGLLFEQLVDLDCLSTFPYLSWQLFFFSLQLELRLLFFIVHASQNTFELHIIYASQATLFLALNFVLDL